MVIVGLFWVIAQIAGAAAKKKSAPTRPVFDNEEDRPTTEDPFADLMRKLSGGQEFNVTQPSGPHPALEKPAESPPPLWNTDQIDDRPKPQPAILEPKPVTPPVEIPSMPEPLPSMSAFSRSMPSFKMPTMDLNFQTLEKTGGNVPTFGKLIDPADQQSVRRAMLSHIIFSKPKAMEGWNASHAG